MELPENFYSLTREQRVKFHADRIAEVMPVQAVLDSWHTGLTIDEIREELIVVRWQILDVERRLENLEKCNAEKIEDVV